MTAIKVERVIEELGLEKVRDSKVGGQFLRGISGGEKKRVSIGCELITDPSTPPTAARLSMLLLLTSFSFPLGLIFLDEPTTGLDSYNSLGVMDRLSALAAHNRAVVCTIHQVRQAYVGAVAFFFSSVSPAVQPRSTIFQNVDQLMILSRGDVVYMGPAKHAVTYFSGLHFQIKPFINPADFLRTSRSCEDTIRLKACPLTLVLLRPAVDVVVQNQERFDRSQRKLLPAGLEDTESG